MRHFLIGLLCLTACAGPLYPLTDGHKSVGVKVHHPPDHLTAVIWGDNAQAISAVSTIILRAGAQLVERTQLQRLLDEQQIRLIHGAEYDADVLRVGRLAGAHLVVFVDTTVTPETSTRGGVVSGYGGGFNASTLYHVSVNVRGVDIETGQVVWMGKAWYPRPIDNPETGIDMAARSAVVRATCGPDLCLHRD